MIERTAPKTYRATQRGLDLLKRHPKTITVGDLRDVPGFEEAWEAGRQKRQAKAAIEPVAESTPIPSASETPDEIIERQVNAVNAVVRERLLKAVLAQTPEFFERLVLEVLQAMGYGGKLAVAPEHLWPQDRVRPCFVTFRARVPV